ncbi:InlB B-repeat-containing protein [Catenisphaera adipataccumulans]|uniref:Putative repeat protein (TIGR02543 family)/putative repeat protein (TIGR01451 family) n=1 Tax=Catenisphaera adipataccumulans TaxID=700500 RepID=A0A7W8FVY8_9FIRM|nr:InlB B-repeat-containing protein [Catenisphaera adipataccumulans]MBB5182711.1 putative repeat protein (TIGR02543 family)/putative repeat protein (TIGR01451 family) [Catenisphaera adipataccumulans]
MDKKLHSFFRGLLSILISLSIGLQCTNTVFADETSNASEQTTVQTSNNQAGGTGGSADTSAESQSGTAAGQNGNTSPAGNDQESTAGAEGTEQKSQGSSAASSQTKQTSAQEDTQKEDETSMPAQDFTKSSSGGVTVSVSAPEGAFPEGTTMTVTDVSTETALSIAKGSSEDPENVVDASGVDITFRNKEGQEIEPANGKQIRVKMTLSRNLEGETFNVIHNDEQNGPTEIADAKKSSASFSADSFSIYVIDGEQPAVATYRFYDENGELLSYSANGKTFNKQKIKNGETLYSPKNPEKSGYIFKGWTTTQGSSTVELDPFSSMTPSVTSTQDINYYPVFEEAHYVFFMDSAGDNARVYETKAGASGDTINTSDVTLASQGDSSFTGWYTDSSLTTPAGDSITLGNENIYLYPKFEEGHYLIFKTGDDATIIAPEFVAAESVTSAPTDPERAGYTFVGWSTNEDATEADFTFGSELSEDTTLYAVWEPATANYTVIFWKQSVTDDKDAADADKTYEYYASETRTGTTESDASPTASDKSKSNINNGDGFHYNSTNSESVQIKGDGSTILNIYYDRDLFTYKFNNNDGSTTSISGLYGATMDQSNVTWPTNEDSVWYCTNNQYYYAYLDAFLPVKNFHYSGNSATITFSQTSGRYTLNYYREAVTGGGFTDDLTPQTFSLDTQFAGWNFENVYSGFTVSKFRVMDRNGNYGNWVSVSSDGSTQLSEQQMMSRSGVTSFGGFDVFYSRNQHGIDYYSGNEIIHQETGIYYEASLASYGEDGENYYVPEEAPTTVPAGAQFAGWYKDPECTVPYDFDHAKMPDDNVIVYAKWELPKVKAKVYDEMGGGSLVDTITVDYGGTVDENLMPNVKDESGNYIVYTNSSKTITIPDDAVWVGWDIKTTDDSGETSYETYSFDTQLTKDIELYPHYVQQHKYKVTYDANGGSGTVTDSKTYVGGDNCYADVQSGSPLTPPTGKVFLYWNTKADGTGTTYYPDDKIKITKDETLYAIYGESPKATDLTYHSNYPSDTGLSEVTTKQTVDDASVLINNQDLTVYTLDQSNIPAPAGYEFIGWKDGNGKEYAPGASIGVDVNDPQPNALYAVWAKKPTKDVFKSGETQSIDGQTVKAGELLDYKITYKNTTDQEETVTITDKIPANSTFQSADNEGSYANGTVTWEKTVAAGESITVKFTVKVKENSGTALENQAVVNDGTNNFNTNKTTNPTPTPPTDPTKDVFKSGETQSIDGKKVQAGDKLDYKITYKNTTGSAQTVNITDAIPSNSEYVDGSADHDGTYSNGTVTWSGITLEDGKSITVKFTVKVKENSGTTLENQAVVNDGTNNFDTNKTTNPTPTPPTDPTKDVFKSTDEQNSIDGNQVKAGDELVYKITYTNTTGADATVDITDAIPENSKYVEGSADNGGTYSNGKVTWNDLSVSKDSSITVKFTVKVKENNGTVLKNKADVIEGTNTYTTNETTNPTPTPPTDPTKDVFKSGETQSIDGQTVKAGELLDYKITYKNTTGADATVDITDAIPANSEYVDGSADHDGTYSNGTVTWSGITLEDGKSITVKFTVKVKENNGTVLKNKADVIEGTNTYTTNETTNPTPTPPTKPKKDVFKSSDEQNSIDGKKVQAGDELLYKITYKNTSNEEKTLTITDAIPKNSSYVENSADNGGTYENGILTWSNITLASGESITVSFKVTVDSNNGTKLTNQAKVNDGSNTYTTNETVNPTPEEPTSPPQNNDKTSSSKPSKPVKSKKNISVLTSMESNSGLTLIMLAGSLLAAVLLERRRRNRA